MKKMKRILLLLALSILFCQQTVLAAGAENTTEAAGVKVTISTDQAEYKAGDTIQYSITVENTNQHSGINPRKFTYSNTEGLIETEEGSMPVDLPRVAAGETITIEGTLTGDVAVFGEAAAFSPVKIIIYIIGVLILLVIIFFILKTLRHRTDGKEGRNDKNGDNKSVKNTTKALVITLAALMLAGAMPAQAAEYEESTVRPYVKFTYAGQEVMIRAVMDLQILQDSIAIASEYAATPKRITCHDPSVFRDFDGSYYIIGSFLGFGRTEDLINWENLDASFQGSFTEDVREQIRSWNADGNAGNWNDYLWAPDVIYNPVLEKYCVYLSANGDNWKSNIVLLTADSIDGPYTYEGSIVYGGFDETTFTETDYTTVTGETELAERYLTNGIANRKWGDMWPNCIDPCVFYDEEGKLWMSYGSWSGGIFMLELDENTGLRDYNVTYEENLHSDPYFGTKVAGGAYASGEASYIQHIGDYYYLFISYGNLEAAGGYNIRVFRSDRPDGDYVDEMGNTPYYDTYSFNYNQSVGIRLFGGYKWRTFTYGQVAQGHNSAFVDEDGKAYIVFHTRTSNGTEGHSVKTHQLFVNKEGWLVAAPYSTSGETLPSTSYDATEIAGEYELIIHELEIDYGNLETKKPEFITLTEDGQITGAYEGTWRTEPGTPYIVLSFGGEDYSGVTLKMNVENTKIETMVFTALGLEDQVTIWGSKSFE